MKLKFAISLSVIAALVFFAAYGTAVLAWPGTDRRGFFYDIADNSGTEVWPDDSTTPGCAAGGGFAIPTWVDSADEFINFTKCKLVSNNGQSTMFRNSERTGAAFLIQTMIGDRGPKITSLSDSRITSWEGVVRAYAANGWINWGGSWNNVQNFNTYYQGCCGGAEPDDDAAYPNSNGGAAITFSDGSNTYVIRRVCANPIGIVTALRSIWNAVGATTVTDGSADAGDTPTSIRTRPGETLRFTHRITNNGPSSAGIWYALFGNPNASNFTGQYFNNTTLSGPPVMTRSDPGELKFDWGSGSPGGGVNADGFSVRWTKTEYLPAGNYSFNVIADDGVRLFVDGSLVIDRWVDQGPTYYNASVNLADGSHTITMEYYENGVGAVAYMGYHMNVQGGVDAGGFGPGDFKDIIQDVPVPPGATPGSQICRRILWDWKNSTATGDFAPYWGTWGMGGAACATVSANYDLNPTVTTPGSGFAQEGETVRFNYFVQNVGGDAGTAQCFVRNQSGGAVTVPGLTCSASQNFPPNASGPPLQVGAEDFPIPGGTPPGTAICRTLHVQPASPTVPSRPSPQRCVTVVKTPYVHFYGGDVWAGGGFKNGAGACPVTSNRITTTSRSLGGANGNAGSMVEYGAFAQGEITQFGSASRALLAGAPVGNLARSLSFANTAGTPGSFAAPPRCLEDFAAQYANVTQTCPSTVNVSAPPANPCRTAGNITMPAGALAGGSRQVYIVGGDVNITGSLTYPATYSSPSNIPSLVIIATGNIRVNGSVRQLDGIFISRGTFFTCQEKPPLPTATCNQDLAINGSVIAKTIDLYRTAGAEGATPAARRAPGEIFNLRPEVFLRNGLNESTKTTITTSDSRELPPRF